MLKNFKLIGNIYDSFMLIKFNLITSNDVLSEGKITYLVKCYPYSCVFCGRDFLYPFCIKKRKRDKIMTEKSKKFLSFFKAEKILMETLNKKQVRLYTKLRSFVVECEFDFSLAVTYLIKKERISKNLDKELNQVVNIFKSIHNIPEKHPSTLLETFDRVDADFITTTCRYYADKKSKKPITIPILPLLEFYNDSTSSDSKPITDRLVLNDQCNQDVTKPLDIDIDKVIDKDILIDIKEKNIKKEKPKKFIPPTLEEVVSYCQERGNNVNPQKFVDYYQSNGWKVGKNSMKDWKASVRTWEGNNFNNKAPPKERDVDDIFKRMIEEERRKQENG